MMQHKPQPDARTTTSALTIKEFCAEFRRSPASVYRDIAAGQLIARKAGGRTLISRSDAEAWFNNLPIRSPKAA